MEATQHKYEWSRTHRPNQMEPASQAAGGRGKLVNYLISCMTETDIKYSTK